MLLSTSRADGANAHRPRRCIPRPILTPRHQAGVSWFKHPFASRIISALPASVCEMPERERPLRRTLAAHHLPFTLLVVSANRRKLRMWIDHQANPTKVTQIAARRDARRARQSLKNFLPDAHAPPGTPATATA